MSYHSNVVARASSAIDAVFSDKSVGRDTTKDSLEDLKEQIDGMLEALKCDEGRSPEDAVDE